MLELLLRLFKNFTNISLSDSSIYYSNTLGANDDLDDWDDDDWAIDQTNHWKSLGAWVTLHAVVWIICFYTSEIFLSCIYFIAARRVLCVSPALFLLLLATVALTRTKKRGVPLWSSCT